METKTVESVQELISERKAKVYTASEFKALVRAGSRPEVRDVDVVTCGTFGVMSGTMAVFSIPIAPPGTFKRADAIFLNGVPGTVGPCPNESLGIVDCVFHGTSRRDAGYGGGHLFRDLVAGERIEAAVHSGGSVYVKKVTLDSIPYARMVLTRCAFKNYSCFINRSGDPAETIFSGPAPLEGCSSEASVSGCGEINPLQNDPEMRFIRAGASVMVNGAPGIVTGTGTRSTADWPNLSVEADMHLMKAEYMGGFRTSAGPECMTSIAVAIPITGHISHDAVSILDKDVSLPLLDVCDRRTIGKSTYASVWHMMRDTVSADCGRCLSCSVCAADAGCPRDAGPHSGPDPSLCMHCGLCVKNCNGGVFSMPSGSVSFDGKTVPIVVRQSSRAVADKICAELRDEVLNGRWNLRVSGGVTR